MICLKCSTQNPEGSAFCAGCKSDLGTFDVTVELAGPAHSGETTAEVKIGTAGSRVSSSQPSLARGNVLGGRYEILSTLGEGGMGAVYKAYDREIARVVALKIIRPELASSPDILRRFRQELVLARQITHRNVIRIHDLGLSDGLRFISMEFVDGRDLGTELEQRQKYEPHEAAEVIWQVAHGLAAAHAENVVHRDLKPRNLMVDTSGRILIMDFGIAGSALQPGDAGASDRDAKGADLPNATRIGTMLGTPNYMSPEQAQGQKADARSDLFTLGVIFFELLTGQLPYSSNDVVETLRQRIEGKLRAPVDVDPAIPHALNAIVVKCLAADPKERYQSTTELLGDLGQYLGVGRRGLTRRQLAAVAAGAILSVSAGSWWWLATRPEKQPDPVSVLVADFVNSTGDALLDGVLEPAMVNALESSSFVNAYNSGQARRIAAQLKPDSKGLDESAARLVAMREGVKVVISGRIDRTPKGLLAGVRAFDPSTGQTMVERSVDVSNRDELLRVVGRLAVPIRKILGEKKEESAQLADAETFTTVSLESAGAYARGQELQMLGQWQEAVPFYEQAIQHDPSCGRAYAGIAAMYANLNRPLDAEKYYKLAMAHIDRMTDREKYRTRGSYYLAMRNPVKAAEQYKQLVDGFPGDRAGYSNLALAHFYGRQMSKAQEFGRKALEISPRSVGQRNNAALYSLYAGDFPSAESEARRVIELNPQFEQAYGTLALALLGQGNVEGARATYATMPALGARGNSLASMGKADLALFEDKLTEARAALEQGIRLDVASKNPVGAAEKQAVLASTLLLVNDRAGAAASAGRAITASSADIVLYTSAMVFVELSQTASAKRIAKELRNRLEPDPQAYGQLIEGEILLKEGESREALSRFQEAQKLSDTWLGRYALGRAFLALKAYTEADAELDLCLKRRGEATSIFLDDIPTFRYLPPVYYYQGLAREGLGSPGSREAFRTFLGFKGGGRGPLVADARRRLGAN